MVVAESLHAQVRQAPDATCLVEGRRRMTFAGLWRASDSQLAALDVAGVGPGAKVAVLSPNSAAAVVTTVSLLRAGSTWLPVNHRDTLTDIASTLRMLGADAVIAHAEVVDTAMALAAEVPTVRTVMRVSAGRGELRTSWCRGDHAPAPRDEGLAAIFTTGGTTGRPKGVAFGRARFAALLDAYRLLVARPDDVNLAVAPLTHGGGRIALGVMTAGGANVVLPSFDAAEVLGAIQDHRVTTMSLTPTMLYRLLDAAEAGATNHSSLRSLVVGGAPITVERMVQAIDVFGPIVHVGYGQTEAPLLISRLRPEHYWSADAAVDRARLATVGTPTPVCSVRILDEAGCALPRGRVGEIAVRGAFTMSGYYREEATETSEVDGHRRTGDLGALDDAGFLTIVGRAKEVIITGGFNVYPAEVEDAIASCPGVRESAVFGVPDPDWGEAVVAAVAVVDGAGLSADGLRTLLRERLGGVKAPKRVHLVAELPRSDNGKIQKRVLAERYAAST